MQAVFLWVFSVFQWWRRVHRRIRLSSRPQFRLTVAEVSTMEPESESSAIPQPTMPRQPLRTLQRTAPLNGVAGRSNHPGSRSDADHAGEENARGGSLRAFAAPFLRVASTCCACFPADDGTTGLVSVTDALGELISDSQRGKRRRKAAEEGVIPNVRCDARHMHTTCVWHACKKTRRCCTAVMRDDDARRCCTAMMRDNDARR